MYRTVTRRPRANGVEAREKAFTAANLKKEQEFYASDLSFTIRTKTATGEKTTTLTHTPEDNAAKQFKPLMADSPEILAVECRSCISPPTPRT